MYMNSIYFILFTILAAFFFWYWGLLCFRSLCTYVLCLLCNYLWNDSILVLARVGNLVFHIHFVNAFELSYLLSKDVKPVLFFVHLLYWKERFFSVNAARILYAREYHLLWWWHIETQYWNSRWRMNSMGSGNQLSNLGEYFFSFCGDISNASHTLSFPLTPTRRIFWLSPKESPQRISAGRCPRVDTSSPSLKADEILILLPRGSQTMSLPTSWPQGQTKWEKRKKHERKFVFICSIDCVSKSMA